MQLKGFRLKGILVLSEKGLIACKTLPATANHEEGMRLEYEDGTKVVYSMRTIIKQSYNTLKTIHPLLNKKYNLNKIIAQEIMHQMTKIRRVAAEVDQDPPVEI